MAMQSTLSPKELAAAVGVSESSLKRWADEGKIRVSRTAGGHRRIALVDAVRFIRESQLDVVRPEVLGLTHAADAVHAIHDHDPGALHEPLYRALHAGEIVEARSMLIGAFLDGKSLAVLCDGPIREALRRLGELYQHSDEGIFIEHRATDICIHTLNQIRMMLPPPDGGAPVAVGGTPSADPYIIPSLMATLVLTDLGYRAMNLGPQMPFDVLAGAALKENAQLAWVSASSPQESRYLEDGIASLADELAVAGASVAVGGRQLDASVNTLRPNVQYVSTMQELAAFARGLRKAVPAGS